MKFNILRVQSRNRKELMSNRGEDWMKKIFKESQGKRGETRVRKKEKVL